MATAVNALLAGDARLVAWASPTENGPAKTSAAKSQSRVPDCSPLWQQGAQRAAAVTCSS